MRAIPRLCLVDIRLYLGIDLGIWMVPIPDVSTSEAAEDRHAIDVAAIMARIARWTF
jgi:hypothetical protein